MGHSGGSTASPPGRCGGLAWDNRGGLRWKRCSPSIHLLPGLDKDARARRDVTELPEVHLGDFALVALRSRQQTDEAAVPADPSARRARWRRKDQGVPGGGFGDTELKREPAADAADDQRPHVVQTQRRTLGRVQKRRQTEEGLVIVDLGKKVLPGKAATWGPAATSLFLLGGHLPGFPLFLIELPPPVGGASKGSPGVALRRAAALAVPGGVALFHTLMSFQFAARTHEGVAVIVCIANRAYQTDRAAINS